MQLLRGAAERRTRAYRRGELSPLRRGDTIISWSGNTYTFQAAYITRAGAGKVQADNLIFAADVFGLLVVPAMASDKRDAIVKLAAAETVAAYPRSGESVGKTHRPVPQRAPAA
jgi:hypothetical protein